MSISIGDNNKISNTTIVENSTVNKENKKGFTAKHPILISLICSFVVGFILLFSFWTEIISWIEGVL